MGVSIKGSNEEFMTQQGTSFRYDAFISYRHKELDRKWAQWLLESLEQMTLSFSHGILMSTIMYSPDRMF